MAAVVGVTLSLLIIFLLLVIALLVAYKKEKMCFKGIKRVSQASHFSMRIVPILQLEQQ